MIARLRDVRYRSETFALEVSCDFMGPVTAIFGRSGAGKSTLLEVIAGLRACAGYIELSGLMVQSNGTQLVSSRDRGIGYVPQDARLFPHLSVRQNLRYSRKSDEALLQHTAGVLEIGHLLDRRVTELSGGERTRVALARAFLAKPGLLLLDEPLASIEHPLRERTLDHLRTMRDELRIPMIYVTHEPREVLALANEVIVLEEGRVVQQGEPGVVLRS